MIPRIGITTSHRVQENEQCLHRAYVEAVERAGALPLPAPMLETEAARMAFAELLDGLVLTGGPAIVEGLVGDVPDDLDPHDPARFEADRSLLRAVRAQGKPVLGICYGMQLLNAEAGGTLYADAERQCAGALVHSPKRGADIHSIRFAPDSRLHAILGADEAVVNTRHIQAVCSIGDGFRITAKAPDGIAEAIESDDGTMLGVQFHPERMGDAMQPLFRYLVERARQHALMAAPS